MSDETLGAAPVVMLALGDDTWLSGHLREWVPHLIEGLKTVGFRVELAVRNLESVADLYLDSVKNAGCKVVSLALEDEAKTDGEFASLVESVSRARNVKVVFVIGEAFSDIMAKRNLRDILWAFPTDTPEQVPDLQPAGIYGVITRVAKGARRIVAGSEAVRSSYEGLVPQASGKTVVLPIMGNDKTFDVSGLFPPIIKDKELPRYSRAPRTNVVIAGADFKFASDIIEALADSPDFDFDAVEFPSNSQRDEKLTLSVCSSADVVIAEFCSPNANWLAKNLRRDQSLIVHLHGYELLADYSAELDIERVHRVILPSEFYLNEAISRRGWPREKLLVIPNGVDSADLNRTKLDGARFHLGVVGYVPFLKRPDRALDLLELLLKQDERYFLHFKGNSPWAYNWEWNKAPNQDAYRAFFQRVGSTPLLDERVIFEPFSPDMGNWLRKIGWVLSPSVRETFHLAPMEAAASGAPPIVWEREGASEIFSDEFTFPDHRSAGKFILSHSEPTSYTKLSRVARSLASRYDSQLVQRKWLAAVEEAGQEARRVVDRLPKVEISAAAPDERLLADLVLELVQDQRWEDALSILNDNIKLTAHSESVLKEIELTVRGVMELDARRFSLFQPYPSRRLHTEPDRPFTVRCPHLAPRTFLRGPSIDLNLDAGQTLALGVTAAGADDMEEDRGTHWVSPLKGCRFDRWLEHAASQIVMQCPETSNTLVAEGPWWVAAASGLAASRLDIPMRWTGLSHDDSRTVHRVRTGSWASNPVEGVISALLVAFPGCLDEEGEYLRGGRSLDAHFARNDGDSISDEIKVKIAYVGDPGSIGGRKLSEYGDLEIFNAEQPLLDQLDVWSDILVVDSSAITYLERVRATDPKKINTTLVGLADRARAFGIPVLWFGTGPQVDFPVAVLRKMDFLAAEDPGILKSILVLNPVSVRSVQELGPHGRFISAALRSCGLPVRATPRQTEPEDLGLLGGSQAPIADPTPLGSTDGVSIVLPTHYGAGRIAGALKSISEQTLPAELIELVIVENGSNDGTLEIARDWAEANPKVKVDLVYQEEPSVGAARNEGIRRATRDYVTFLDDDDFLEANALFSWWSTATDDIVVAGRLVDMLPDGRIIEDTPQNSRVRALRGGLSPLRSRAGLLSLNAAKLIPRKRLAGIEYNRYLKSGEDVAFMAELLRHRDLYFAPAAPMPASSYVRTIREGSVSRREESFRFAVSERLAILKELHTTFEDAGSNPSDKGAIQLLARGQMQFIATYLNRNPSEKKKVSEMISTLELPDWMMT